MNLDIEMLQVALGQMALEIIALKTTVKKLENEKAQGDATQPKSNGADYKEQSLQ